MNCRRMLVVLGPSTDAADASVRRVLARLEAMGCELRVHDAVELPSLPTDEADLLIVFGGDGAFLGAARLLAGTDVPVVGVNMGRLGFLTEFSEQEFLDSAEAIVAGRFETRRRMMLAMAVHRDGREIFAMTAMNEVSLLAGHPFRMIELSASCRGVDLGVFVGDGLIVASPTGSTGHTLSAGGPILEPALRAMILTPLAAHSLSMRPVVTAADGPVEVQVLACNAGTSASIDGQANVQLAAGDRVSVQAADKDLVVVQNPDRPFFSTLRTKLQWNASPHHRTS